MLSVVVDDHDMGVTHIVRGDDHLTNAFRQLQMIKALGWDAPTYAHIPLIHGPDGKKLSKRHGALGVDAYRDMGYLPEALRNYLLRLGWGHGDVELISTDDATALFALEDIGRGAARFDFKKLANFNGHYIREADDTRLVGDTQPFLEKSLGRPLNDRDMSLLQQAMPGLKARAKTLVELADSALFLFRARPLELTEKAANILNESSREILAHLVTRLSALETWTESTLEQAVQDVAEQSGIKLGKVAQPMRAALTGSTVSPGIYDVLLVLGREESLERLKDQAGT
jgi:glutamyl-tRNA synthetase